MIANKTHNQAADETSKAFSEAEKKASAWQTAFIVGVGSGGKLLGKPELFLSLPEAIAAWKSKIDLVCESHTSVCLVEQRVRCGRPRMVARITWYCSFFGFICPQVTANGWMAKAICGKGKYSSSEHPPIPTITRSLLNYLHGEVR